MIRSRKPDAKLRALKESGAANPDPQDVRDDAFADSDFFDPRDLVQVRYEMLRRVRKEGHSVAKATSLFGVSRPTFYKVQKDFDDRGLIGLLPNKRGPRGRVCATELTCRTRRAPRKLQKSRETCREFSRDGVQYGLSYT